MSSTHVITAFSPTEGLVLGISTLLQLGVKTSTRNGDAWTFDGTVITEYTHPHTRVLFSPHRDANPFFHLAESAWMLMGRNDIKFLTDYAKNMANYSVDGKTQHAAYGHRWFNHFGFDQVTAIINKLKAQPNTRQAVLQIWDSKVDLVDSKENATDRACNVSCVFTPRTSSSGETSLDMMVSNRSNDIVWGAYGANAVHFSFLHHLVAELSGFEVGVYRQVSDNYHMYGEALYGKKLFNSIVNLEKKEPAEGLQYTRESNLGWLSSANDYISSGKSFCTKWMPVNSSVAGIQADLEDFFGSLNENIRDSSPDETLAFAVNTAHQYHHGVGLVLSVLPVMMIAHALYKAGRPQEALEVLEKADQAISSEGKVIVENLGENPTPPQESPCNLDWFHAGHTWIQRRM